MKRLFLGGGPSYPMLVDAFNAAFRIWRIMECHNGEVEEATWHLRCLTCNARLSSKYPYHLPPKPEVFSIKTLGLSKICGITIVVA